MWAFVQMSVWEIISDLVEYVPSELTHFRYELHNYVCTGGSCLRLNVSLKDDYYKYYTKKVLRSMWKNGIILVIQ